MDRDEMLFITTMVEILQKDFRNYLSKWIEVQGLSVRLNDIKEPENGYSIIMYN